MVATNVTKQSSEGYLSYTLDDINWIEIGYVTDFNFQRNKNLKRVYEHGKIAHTKKGNQELTGSVGHLFPNTIASVLALEDAIDFGLKLEIKDDWGDIATETIYLTKVTGDNFRFNMGGRDGDMEASFDFVFGTWYAESDETYTVTFNVTDGSGAIEGATVIFGGRSLLTDSSGEAEFENIAAGVNLPYTVVKSGFETVNSALDVDGNDVTEEVVMSSL